jgi:predicted phosphodiesterase
VYSNYLALDAAIRDARARGVDAFYCLGDVGAFGPHPDRVFPLLVENEVVCLQGNYDDSIGNELSDCQCGYTDPRDNHFAALSYGYTERHCSPDFKAYMDGLPTRRRVRVGSREMLLVHGSPRQVNEFLFASTSSTAYLEALCDENRCDGILCTHTGLRWHRRLPSGRDVVNVGVIGRPANDGNTNVWYAMLSADDDASSNGVDSANGIDSANGGGLDVELVPLAYDYESLAGEMRREQLPEEFVETILTGWWTTCLEILPAKERASSKF